VPWPVYAPRCQATLTICGGGDSPNDRIAAQTNENAIVLDVRPTKVRLTSNSINEADECELTIPYDQVGMDPRYMRDCEVAVYLADADPSQNFSGSFANQRFLGMAKDVSRVFNETEKTVTIKAQDYTCLFLEMKNYPKSQIPALSLTLPQAWALICNNTGYVNIPTDGSKPFVTSSVPNLIDKIEYWDDDGNVVPLSESKISSVTLGSAMSKRAARLGKVQLHHEADAWALWKSCCDQMGLITFIRMDRCVVTTATDFYTKDDPPVFIYGLNVKTLKESHDLGSLSSKLVCVRSYDPLLGTSLEALFPQEGSSLAAKRPRLGASAKKATKVLSTQEYECFDLPFAVTDQNTLNSIAERIWYERVRQELSGTLTTVDMTVPTVSTSGVSSGQVNKAVRVFDMLQLQSGDAIQIVIERNALDAIQAALTPSQRARLLTNMGYEDDMVQYISNNTTGIDTLPGQFLVHNVTTDIDFGTGDSEGTFSIEVNFVNRIDISGSGTVAVEVDGAPVAGVKQPPLDQQKIVTAQ